MQNPNVRDHEGETLEAAALLTVDIVHQFRERLTVLLSSLEQLRRQSLDDRGRQQLERANLAARLINEIIDGVQPLK